MNRLVRIPFEVRRINNRNWFAEKGWGRGVITTFVAMVFRTSIIFVFGVAWLGFVVGWEKPFLQFGFPPFLPGATFEIVLAAVILPLVRRSTGNKL